MWLEWTIATKFLREARTQTALIMVGIAVGVSVIVFLSALIDGLQDNIIERTLGTQAHIKVEAPDEVNQVVPLAGGTMQLVLEDKRAQRLRSINNWQQVRDALDALPEVTAVSPLISGPAFARRGSTLESVALMGIDEVRYQKIIPIRNDMVAGQFRVGAGDAVIGSRLAWDLGLRVGDKLRLDAGQGVLEPLLLRVRSNARDDDGQGDQRDGPSGRGAGDRRPGGSSPSEPSAANGRGCPRHHASVRDDRPTAVDRGLHRPGAGLKQRERAIWDQERRPPSR